MSVATVPELRGGWSIAFTDWETTMDTRFTWARLALIGFMAGTLSCKGGVSEEQIVQVDHSSPRSFVQSLFKVARAKDGVAIRQLCSPSATELENGNFCAARHDTEMWTLDFIYERFGSCAVGDAVTRDGDVAHVPYTCERGHDRAARKPIVVIRVDDRWYLHPEPGL